KLSETKRVKLEILIKEQAVAYAIAMVNQRVIDRINILEASRLAMVRAVQKLPTQPQYLLIDALKLPLEMRQTSLIHGDARSISIAAASILAKNYRDRLMVALDQRFPGYGWRNNKGYPTQAHRQAIMELGFSCIHRKTFKVKP
ncbi:MAG: ribonuclease HII, partial [Clostridiales bacterium]